MSPTHMPPGVTPDQPGEGQTSVWTYPRPPVIEADTREAVLTLNGTVICRTTNALKVLETSHPPVWYLPERDFAAGVVTPGFGSSYCEFKGTARYFNLVTPAGPAAERSAWTYLDPARNFTALIGHIAVYAQALDSVTVAGELVVPQPGGFYGGWITADVCGPFKGVPGSSGW